MSKVKATLALSSVLLAGTAFAGGKVEALTPGWDGFPSLTSGSVSWSTAGDLFQIQYTLDGALTSHGFLSGMHHMDVPGPVVFGGGTTSLGPPVGDTITREGHTSTVVDTTFGFVTTDGSGDAVQPFQFNPNPGTYAVQFHLREGGPPGCPTTSCNADYRTGTAFATHLTRFTIPGSVSFWGGDESTGADSVGGNDLTTHGSVAYQAGHFRTGFALDGSSSYLDAAAPVAGGLLSAGGFTISVWLNQDSFASAASIVNARTAANASGFTLEPLFLTPGTIALDVNTSGVAGDFALLTAPGFPTGQLIWLAATFDAATHTMRLVRDGALVAERTDVPGTTMAVLGTEQFVIGRNIVTNAFVFDGVLDEIAYFDSALPLEQLRGVGGWLFADGFEVGNTAQWSATSQ